MTDHLEPDLQGHRLFNRYVVLFAIFLGIVAAAVAAVRRTAHRDDALLLVPVLLVCYICLFVLYILLIYFLCEFVVSSTGFRGVRARFHGRIAPFIGLNVKWVLLSVVTLGICVPWYVEKVIGYLLASTEYDGDRFAFLGKGGRLFLIVLLTYFLPLVVVTALFALIGSMKGGAEESATSALISLFTLVVTLPYTYLVIRWMIDLRFRGARITLKAPFFRSILVLFVQYLLMIVTLYIYFPVAMLKIYSHFLSHTRAEGEGVSVRLGFDGDMARGFLLIWGQTLLTAITLGVYYPWAAAKVLNWVLSHVSVDFQEAEGEIPAS